MLSQGCNKLLASQDYSDMKFILASNNAPLAPSHDDATTGGEDRTAVAGVVIPAHRVIVAARCEYFKRALRSGMKEAIDK